MSWNLRQEHNNHTNRRQICNKGMKCFFVFFLHEHSNFPATLLTSNYATKVLLRQNFTACTGNIQQSWKYAAYYIHMYFSFTRDQASKVYLHITVHHQRCWLSMTHLEVRQVHLLTQYRRCSYSLLTCLSWRLSLVEYEIVTRLLHDIHWWRRKTTKQNPLQM